MIHSQNNSTCLVYTYKWLAFALTCLDWVAHVPAEERLETKRREEAAARRIKKEQDAHFDAQERESRIQGYM